MSTFLRSLLVLGLCFSISCSRGGAGDSPAAGNGNGNGNGNNGTGGGVGNNGPVSAKPDFANFQNQAGTILGQWAAGTVYVGVSNNTIKIAAQCDDGTTNTSESKITLTQNQVQFLETKKTGTGKCEIAFENGRGFTYTLAGDQLTIDLGGQQATFTRVNPNAQPTPTPAPAPAPGNGGGNNGGAGAGTFDFYESANCQGRKFTFTKGMDCTRLAGSPVSSVGVNAQCQDFGGQLDAGSLCQQINGQ